MPNNLDAYFPEFWAREGLIHLRNRVAMPKLVFTDFSTELASAGDTVNTRQPTAVASAAKSVGSDYVDQNLAPTNVAILLNKHRYVAFNIEGKENSLTPEGSARVLRDHVVPAISALADDVNGDLLALHADVTSEVGTAATDLTYGVCVDANKKLNDNKVPSAERFAVVSSKDEANLLKAASTNSLLVKANERGSAGTLTEGALGRFLGIDWHMNQAIKTTTPSSGVTQYNNLAFHRNAFAFVSRTILPTQMAGAGVSWTTQSDADSGLNLTLHWSWDSRRGAMRFVFEMLYGVKTLNEKLAVKIKT